MRRLIPVILVVFVFSFSIVPAFAASSGVSVTPYLGVTSVRGDVSTTPVSLPSEWLLMSDAYSFGPPTFGSSPQPLQPLGAGFAVSSLSVGFDGSDRYYGIGYYPFGFEINQLEGPRPLYALSSSGLPSVGSNIGSRTFTIRATVSVSEPSGGFLTGFTPVARLYMFDENLTLLDTFAVMQTELPVGGSDLIFNLPAKLDGVTYWSIALEFVGASATSGSSVISVNSFSLSVDQTVKQSLEDSLSDFRESLDAINSQVFPDLSQFDFVLTDFISADSIAQIVSVLNPLYSDYLFGSLLFVAATGGLVALIVFGRRD